MDKDSFTPLRMSSSSPSPFSVYDACCFGAGVAGNIFALVLFISPLPTFRRIVRSRSTEHFSGLPYVYSLFNCLICLWYGLPFVSYGVILVVTVNATGALFQLAYILVFILFTDARKKLNMFSMLAATLCLFGILACSSLVMFDHPSRKNFVGYLSVASLISMFASPLFIMNLVIKTRSVEFMPFYLSLSTFLMSASFFTYGLLLHDLFITIPNGIGAILGTVQLLLYAYYSRSSTIKNPLLVDQSS